MFYILTSHNIHALDRQFDTLPKEETTVLINTLDKAYEEAAVDYCSKEDIRYFVTLSDGSAATGKNTFLDQFDKDGIPYAVLIDGDDHLTDYGVQLYRKLSQQKDAPDAVVLINAITKNWPNHVASNDLFLNPDRPNLDPRNLPIQMSIASTVVDWDELKQGGLLVDNYKNTTAEQLKCFQDYIELFEYGMGINEIAARVTFMSRKALQVRYNKKFVVGEDTFQYLELKDLHDRGKLRLVMHDEGRPTYMYDARISGIAVYESQKEEGKGFIDWMFILKAELQRLKNEGRLHNTGLTEWLTV